MLTPDILLVFCVLGVTIFLFATEKFRVDVIAILVMLSLGWLGLLDGEQVFSGFSSNAVIAIIGVMIMGYGVDKSGVMNRITRPIINFAGSNEKKLIGLVSITVGLLSSLIQNIGAAALFLPALMRISKISHIPASRLLMPMGYAAILGGTVTMVGASTLIILNDLLAQGGYQPFGLFSVTPIGLILLFAGVSYFIFFGKYVLPSKSDVDDFPLRKNLIDIWHLPSEVHHCGIPPKSSLVGKTREESHLRTKYHLNLIALSEKKDLMYAPWRYTRFSEGQQLALLGSKDNFLRFVSDYSLKVDLINPAKFSSLKDDVVAGFAEAVVPPHSPVIGKTLKEFSIRKNMGVEAIVMLRGDEELWDEFSDLKLKAGDVLVVYGLWENIKAMQEDPQFVVLTPFESNEDKGANPVLAISCFLAAITLTFLGVKLSLALFSGAAAMVFLRVISIDEAYKAVHWRTVFLLAGLIPLGIAMDTSGAAEFIASGLMKVIEGKHPLILYFMVGILASLFSLFMSNAAATVVLVPLALHIGATAGVDPRSLALLVGLCASNSFILPTHHVNALLMAPGGYRNRDYMKAGGIMSIIFLFIAVSGVYLMY